MSQDNCPFALFDAIKHIEDMDQAAYPRPIPFPQDYACALAFIKGYQGSQGTFNSYRREVERLLHWSWWILKSSIKDLTREDIEQFIAFCQKPPADWIGIKKVPRFLLQDGLRCSNPTWRPFVATVSKSAYRQGQRADIKAFALSSGAIREMLAILNSFLNYCVQEHFCNYNPIALVRQKNKFIRRQQGPVKIRRLSELQWTYVIDNTKRLAESNPEKYERCLFLLSALYAMYLRISELVASDRWQPQMNDFFQDQDGQWWFTTVGKGNKQRQIAVSQAMLNALKRWRRYLGLSTLPTVADQSPLVPKVKGVGPITSTHYIRDLIQDCFDQAYQQMQKDGLEEDAAALQEATVHWLRHTGISDDIKHRPREHVRDDAGHSSSAITDKYIDIELRERHRSARDKPLHIDDE